MDQAVRLTKGTQTNSVDIHTACRRCGAEKETSVHILCECPVLEKIRMQTLGFVRMDPEQIKEARQSAIVALGKGAGLLNSPP